jgi:hypothetical protein
MENLIIKSSSKTPDILFSVDGNFDFSGKMFPEDCRKFFEPINSWLEEYLKNPAEVTIIKFKLEYFCDTSVQYVYEMLKILKKLKISGKDLNIDWYYTNASESTVQDAEDYSSAVGIPINIIKIEKFDF